MDGKFPSETPRRHLSFQTEESTPLIFASARVAARRFVPRTAALLLAAQLVLLMTGNGAARDEDAIAVQGGWAYTQRDHGNAAEYMATTKAGEDDVWLVLACSADERLAVSAIHSTRFPYPLSSRASVELRSSRVPRSSIAARGNQTNSLFIDPGPMRHILPRVMRDEQLFLSIPEQNGTMHDYTFSLQPNDVALKAIRLRCLDDLEREN